jgi:hypothetical protein
VYNKRRIFGLIFIFLISRAYPTPESSLEQMSTDEKIGQLFMIAGYIDSDFALRETKNPNTIQDIDTFITKYHVGGIGFVGPSLAAPQVLLINRYQEMAKNPFGKEFFTSFSTFIMGYEDDLLAQDASSMFITHPKQAVY